MDGDEYWKQHRTEYAGVEYYAMCAHSQLTQAIARLSEEDPVKRGAEFERGHPGFTGAAYLAEELFHIPPDFIERVCVRPDPCKSPGRWRVYCASIHRHVEGHATTDQVRKYLG